MTYAKISNGAIEQMGELHELWPNVGFGPFGPNDAWLVSQNAVKVENKPAYYDQGKTTVINVQAWLTPEGKVQTYYLQRKWKPHDTNTEKLVPVEEYVEGSDRYVVQVVPLTSEELVEKAAADKATWRNSLKADRRQLRRALLSLGQLAAADAAIDALSEEDKIDFKDAIIFRRTDSIIEKLRVATNRTPAQFDNLFTLAATF